MHHLESKRGELELNVLLNCEPAEFMECGLNRSVMVSV